MNDPQERGRRTSRGELLARCRVDRRSLSSVRREVWARLHEHVGEDPALDYLLAVGEVTTNVVEHGGGYGELMLWRHPGKLVCQVRDEGPGFDDLQAGTQAPAGRATGGYGLYLARQLCDGVEIASQPGDTTVCLILHTPGLSG